MPASVGLIPEASASTSPGKVAEPDGVREEREPPEHHPCAQHAAGHGEQDQLESASRRNGRSARSMGEGTAAA